MKRLAETLGTTFLAVLLLGPCAARAHDETEARLPGATSLRVDIAVDPDAGSVKAVVSIARDHPRTIEITIDIGGESGGTGPQRARDRQPAPANGSLLVTACAAVTERLIDWLCDWVWLK